MKFIKESGNEVPFNKTKIKRAIEKSMKATGLYYPDIARIVAKESEIHFGKLGVGTRDQVEQFVYERLCHYGQFISALAYQNYRVAKQYQSETFDTDDDILGLIGGSNKEVIMENSNKNASNISTQRDLIAGEVSKSIARRKILPLNILQAHDDGIIHQHDMDYAIQKSHNCDLVNLKDMFENGTIINNVMVETPKSFQVACTVATQIMAAVASSQYGGQTISVSHLAPYLRVSREKLIKEVEQEGLRIGIRYNDSQLKKIVGARLEKEIKAGIQTIQYQINTLATSNGQSPFVSLALWIDEDPEYQKENAIIIKEILEQRIKGVKNEKGVYITPAFPKLLYFLDDNNTYEGSEYFYLTEIAAKCSAKRLVPDYISVKVMKENIGHAFPCINKPVPNISNSISKSI